MSIASELRHKLMATGYSPIPVEGKAPPMKAWQTFIETNDDQIQFWDVTYPRARSTGILCKFTPALDVDILDQSAAEAVETLARERFEERGHVLVRIGQAPKRAILFRTNDPFDKITVNLIAGNGMQEKIELLCNGQQVVAFGIHPGTRQPYTWFGGEPGEIKHDDLPYLSVEEARQLVQDAAELLCREHGYRRAKQRPKKSNGADQTEDAADWSYLTSNVLAGREWHDSLRDLAAKLVASGTGTGAAINHLRGLMDASTAPHDDRWQERRKDIPRLVESAEGCSPVAISATPFVWRDPVAIPPRQWLYGKHYVRQYLTCTIAPGGLGKTSLAIGEALAMASGKALLGIPPIERARVWYWNGEDPRDELDRRIVAAMIEHKLTPMDIDGHLFVNSGRETPIVLATQTRSGTIIAKPVVDAMIEEIKLKKIDVVIIDPFVKSHRVAENDNSAVDQVATQWAQIADVTNCAIELLHHPRKTGGAEITVEDGRGAVALLSASRSARVLNRMTKEEATKATIDERELWRHFRVDNGKASMAHPQHANWYRLASVALGNGDDVGVAIGWSWPDPFDGVTVHDLRAVQKAVSEGGPWRANHQAKMWVGKPIAKALGLNIAKDGDRQKVRAVLAKWISTGMFVVVDGQGSDRHPAQFVEVGTWAND